MRRAYGVTLLEILTVIAIVALLIALLIPVIHSSVRRSRETRCISNMRQLVAALLAYRQDYGQFPPYAQYVFPYTKSREVFVCPHDYARDAGGANWFFGGNRYARQNRISLSYFYFADPIVDHELLIRTLPEVDPNHGILACVLHGDCNFLHGCRHVSPPTVYLCCHGLTLRARIDGSVQRVMTYIRPCTDPDGSRGYRRDYWNLFTDAPCPPTICRSTCE